MRILAFTVITALAGLVACNRADNIEPERAGPEIPAHFPAPVYQAENNAYSKDKIEIGRHLFYEEDLSLDGTISCASCHAQVHAFADHNTPVSAGIYGRLGKRNSPSLMNLIWNKSFMWDGRAAHIELMPLAPITDTLEMASNLDTILARLNRSMKYRTMFEKAFGPGKINDQMMFHSLAQFMAVLVSANSTYDQYVQGKATFNESQTRGLQLFRQNCSACHTEPLFTDYSFRNTGLDAEPKDIGRMRITQQEEDRGKFKVPTLRNIAITYPYMHDGRFLNLTQVLDHYSSGVHENANTDPLVKNITLSETEKADIIAFLNTLSDFTFLSNPAFKTP
jgi:cytochrome c peroxidase